MKIHQEEQKIIDLFRRNIFAEYTLKDIMKKLSKKSYNWTHKAIIKLSKGLLKLKLKGNTKVVSLDLDCDETINYLVYLDRQEALSKKIPLISELIKSISKKTPYFTLLVTGSYATGTQRTRSDIDVVLIIDDTSSKEELRAYIKNAVRLSGIEIETHVFTKSEFYKMLLADPENFGKEVFRKHLLFYGADAYYQIIREASRNGLQTKIRLS